MVQESYDGIVSPGTWTWKIKIKKSKFLIKGSRNGLLDNSISTLVTCTLKGC